VAVTYYLFWPIRFKRVNAETWLALFIEKHRSDS
jgi:hypothetical protein